ncbi:MAG: dipeptide epimerase [Microbacteriaceae bacterium]|nr:dipeptide epimerase [Microbacteriaceae bacterium]
MTAIERVLVHEVPVPLVRPFVTAVRTARDLRVMLVELVDSDGASGWGEAPASWRVTGESPESIRAVVEGPLGEAVLGRDPDDLERLGDDLAASVVGNASARSAVDCALHDLAARRLGLSLAGMLAGHDTAVCTDMTLSAGPADRLAAEAVEWAARGFGTIKVKLGTGGDEVDRMRRVRDAVGPGVRLRVDANQGWTAAGAVEIITAWQSLGLGIELVEQPTPARDLDALAFVTERVDTPVLADESAWTALDLREIIRRRAADLVNVKLAKAGGLTEARRMVALAQGVGMGVIVGCMIESTVGVTAAASLASAIGGVTHDLDAGLWLAAPTVEGGAKYRGDAVVLADGPGTGIRGLAS